MIVPLIAMGISALTGSRLAKQKTENTSGTGTGTGGTGTGGTGTGTGFTDPNKITIQASIKRIATSEDWKNYRQNLVLYTTEQAIDDIIARVNENSGVAFFGDKKEYNWYLKEGDYPYDAVIQAWNNLYVTFKNQALANKNNCGAGSWIPVIGTIGAQMCKATADQYLANLEEGRKLRKRIMPQPPVGFQAYI